jgi:hypothetical protein
LLLLLLRWWCTLHRSPASHRIQLPVDSDTALDPERSAHAMCVAHR